MGSSMMRSSDDKKKDRKSASTRREFLARFTALGVAMPLTATRRTESRSAGIAQTVCVFSKHLQHLDFDEMAEAVARMGFDGIDLTVRPGGHIEPERAVEEIPRAVKAARAVGVQIPMMTTAVNSADDPLTVPVLQTAAENGIKAYRLGYLRFDDTESIEDMLDSYRARLEALAEINRQFGIHGDYQNHAGTNVGGPVWDLWYLLKDLDPQWIGCQYDIRHAFVEGARAWPLGLRALHRHIKTCCIKDFRWDHSDERWQILNVPIGEGMVPFQEYLELSSAYGIDALASMHFEYPMIERNSDPRSRQGKEAIEKAMVKDLTTYRKMLLEVDG
jgi:sugar phosphate isomerase/epimerase